MEENVALDSNKQKQFVKSIKGLKKLMKKTGPKREKTETKDEVQKEEKPETEKIPQEKAAKKKRKPKGLVYLSHIPHGFYENEMTQYFKQFGVVTNVRVIRSKRTGRSKGHAFVEFKNTDVAQVVSETMNNYLMGKRLIKAVYIPPKEQRKSARRKNWNDKHNPGSVKKLQMKKAYNSNKTENDDLKIAKKLLSNLSNTKNKLKELGIDYDFFTPVDIPEALTNNVIVKEERDEDVKIQHDEKVKIKDAKGKVKQNKSNLNNDKKKANVTISEALQSKESEIKKSKNKKLKQNKKSKVTDHITIPNKEIIINLNKKEQAIKEGNKKTKLEGTPKPIKQQKQIKIKNAEVKPPEDFIKLGNEENEDSDSSYQFDSDEYENMINNDDSDDSANTDNDEIPDQKIVKNKKSKDLPAKKKNQGNAVAAQTVHVTNQGNRQQKKNKRKGSERIAEQSKKPKFEKQTKKKLPNKQLKKIK